MKNRQTTIETSDSMRCDGDVAPLQQTKLGHADVDELGRSDVEVVGDSVIAR